MKVIKQKISCFLPCRSGSERVPFKNTKPFGKYKFGLIENKLNQLLRVELIDEVIVSTNDVSIIDFINKNYSNSKIIIDKRRENLCANSTSTDDLIKYVSQTITETDHILWTHVTTPFFDALEYNKAIKDYLNMGNDFDSLMGVTELKTFIWDEKKPLNYRTELERWPRTQTLKSLYEVNSSVFLAKSEIYQTLQNRIGNRPKLYSIDKIKSLDIDWPEDFELAEAIQKSIYEKNK